MRLLVIILLLVALIIVDQSWFHGHYLNEIARLLRKL